MVVCVLFLLELGLYILFWAYYFFSHSYTVLIVTFSFFFVTMTTSGNNKFLKIKTILFYYFFFSSLVFVSNFIFNWYFNNSYLFSNYYVWIITGVIIQTNDLFRYVFVFDATLTSIPIVSLIFVKISEMKHTNFNTFAIY